MSGERISYHELMTLLEAARWAPSAYNEQEWRFLFALRDTEHWDTFFNLLVEANQSWCKQAAALIVVCSNTLLSKDGSPNPVHEFDAGAAFQNLALQGTVSGLVVHGMSGFDTRAAVRQLQIPPDHEVHAMVAVGRPGDPSELPEDLQDRETPSSRKPLDSLVAEGHFNF